MFEQVALDRAVRRANEHLAGGDPDGARAELAAFVAKHPRSVGGWHYLHTAVSRANGTLEQRLDVLRAAVKAVPYEVTLVDRLVSDLIESCILIGSAGYLDEAASVLDLHEEVLGESPESMTLRALVERFRGNSDPALRLCERAEQSLRDYPDPSREFKLAMCLAAIPGQEARGLEMGECVAQAAKSYGYFLVLSVVSEDIAPDRAVEFRERAERHAPADTDIQRDLEVTRADLRAQRDYLATLPRR